MLEFDRRYVLLPVLVCIAVVISAFVVTEWRREMSVASINAIQRSEQRSHLLTEILSAVSDAESAQRGYLLTGNEMYLGPYKDVKDNVNGLLLDLRAAYDSATENAMAAQAVDLNKLVATKFAEIDATLALYEKGRAQAMALVRTDFGQRAMGEVRELTRTMGNQEREFVRTKTEEWRRTHLLNRYINGAGVLLNVILILLAGSLITRDLRRRAAGAAQLESQVARSTAELSELSTYLQRVSERERSSLARELHDELGGLLIALKMDLTQLKAHVNISDPAVKARWERIQSTLSSGINLKRRVIEQLRPSLLDNMGLVAALRWQASEICEAAGIKLIEQYPDPEPHIAPDAAIAFFRIAQEALTNIVKHARASNVDLLLSVDDNRLTLRIEDDGVGMSATRKIGSSHGIVGMRHRLKSFDGIFVLEDRPPHGTRLIASVRLDKVSVEQPSFAVAS